MELLSGRADTESALLALKEKLYRAPVEERPGIQSAITFYETELNREILGSPIAKPLLAFVILGIVGYFLFRR